MTNQPNRFARLRSRPALAVAAAALLAVGGAIGAVAVETSRPAVTMAPATPVAIRTLADDGIVTIRGRVAERFGNKFVLADPTGRALVDLGREGDDAALVAVGQAVTVQGRFDDGFVHAAFLVGADGKVHALRPLGGGHRHGRHGPDRDGPDHDGSDRDGPARRDDGPATPPAVPNGQAGTTSPATTAAAPGA